MDSGFTCGIETNRRGDFGREFLLHAAVVVALALVFIPVLLHPTEVLYAERSDLLSGHLPYRHLMAESVFEHGRLPRYNSTSFGGIPLIGDPQSGLAYPPNWLHLLGSRGGGPEWFGWLILLHLCVGGFGVLWWLRGQGFGPAARLAGAMVFTLAGKWLFHMLVPGHIGFAPVAWVPWQLALIDRLGFASVRRNRPGGRLAACAMLGVVTALAVTGLHPQLLLYTQTLVALYALQSLAGRRPSAEALPGFVALAAAGLLGLGLAAIHLLPMFDSVDLFVRGDGLSYGRTATASLSVSELAGLLLPSRVPGNWEACVFVGGVALGLACFAPWRRTRRGTTLFFLALFAVSVMYALGTHAPLHRWAFDHVPGYDAFRLPRRVLLVLGIPLAYLAASGTDALCQNPPTRSKRALAIVGVAAAALLLATSVSHETLWAAAALSFPALCLAPWPSRFRTRLAGLAVLLVFADGVRFIAHRIETRPLEKIVGVNRIVEHIAGAPGRGRVLGPKVRHFLEVSSVSPTYATPAGVESLLGYNPLIPRATYDYLLQGVAQSTPSGRDGTTLPAFAVMSRRHLDLFDTRWIVTYRRHSMAGLELREIFRGQGSDFGPVFLYENTERLPRAFLARAARRVAGVDAAIAAISQFDPRHEVLVEEASLDGRTYPGQFRAVDAVHHGDEIEIEVDAGRGGFLVLSEIAYPGWQARDNGAPLPIHRANGIFQTVELGPGHHHLRFEYLPQSFQVGRAVTTGSVAIVLGMLVLSRRWRAQDTARSKPD